MHLPKCNQYFPRKRVAKRLVFHQGATELLGYGEQSSCLNSWQMVTKWRLWDEGRSTSEVHFEDSTLHLQSTSCLCENCGPMQSEAPFSVPGPVLSSMVTLTECRKPQSWALIIAAPSRYTNPGHCVNLNQPWNSLPLLMIHGARPWHPSSYGCPSVTQSVQFDEISLSCTDCALSFPSFP